MNARKVLSKILTLLSSEEVSLTFAKLKDGTIVESSTFDVGEALDIVSEDGAKTPAPDGTHELSLRDSEGKETLIKVITKGGKIEERENVELADADLDVEKVEAIPQADGAKAVEDVQMAEETDEAETIPEDDDKEDMKEEEKDEKEIELKDMVEKLAYRIEEMEKKMKMGEEKEKMKEEEKVKEEEEEKMEEEKELPKLDGAPIETKMSLVEANKKNYGKNVVNSQASFLSKLYK